ncbi:IPT/TIG domain-containing protein [Kitasatospora sp. NPDC097691]|uniref:IPT/TIG domain-containing protein n=1 Tax=Kitasatospora sp. NPDC097691 TaxID=3157231 RepID=UPI00332BD29C
MATQQGTPAAATTAAATNAAGAAQTASAQVAMTLAGIAATAATPRPSGESVADQCARAVRGIGRQLADPALATAGAWALLWAALSEDNANMAYLAKSTDASNQFAVVLRGTVASSMTDLLEDLDVGAVVPFTALGTPAPVWVSTGAMEAFTQVMAMSGQGSTLVQALSAALATAPADPTVLVVGHSLGGCLATMVAPYLQTLTWPGTTAPAFGLYTFAAPTAGGRDFADYITNKPAWAVNARYVNCWDVVPLAWTSIDEAKGWYPDNGPAAGEETKEILTAIASLSGPHVYAQPGPATTAQPQCTQEDDGYVPDTDLQRKSLQDFMGQAAHQHANDTYLHLMGAQPLPPGPQVTGISPATGTSGTQVTITGAGFDADSVVDFGPFACTGATVSTAGTAITVAAPEGIGVTPVRVTTSLGTSPAVPTGRFAYGGPAPVLVTGINPTSGNSVTTSVTIDGVNFASDATVYFGDVQAPAPDVTPPGQITVKVPAKTVTGPSTVNVTVVSNGYSSPAGPADEFTYSGL